MARIPIADENEPTIDSTVCDSLAAAGKARGRLFNVYQALANRPEALRTLSVLWQTVYRVDSTLAPQYGELAYLTATSINDCFY